MKESFDKLPPWGKVIVVVVLIIVAFYLFNYAKGYITGVKSKAIAKGEINQLQNQGIQQTYPDQRYYGFADDLETAMAGWGTNEEAIFDVMRQIKNDIDFLKLQNAFSVRGGENLSQWLRGDLDSGEMGAVNTILGSNGVTYRF